MTVHNRCYTTLNCLESLFKNQSEEFLLKVYLVDDGSSDNTAEFVNQRFPQVLIIPGEGNLYWNRGMLLAWETAAIDKPDFFLWLNDDTMLHATAIETMLNAYRRIQEECIISGTISSSDYKMVTYGGWKKEKLVKPNGTIQAVDKINGNVVLVAYSIYEKIGKLAPRFHHSYGDWEYGIRALHYGIKLFITPKYIGTCNRHDLLRKCFDPQYRLNQRWNDLYSPTGPCPFDMFYYDIKCNNLIYAVKNFLILHFRCIVPKVWIALGKN